MTTAKEIQHKTRFMKALGPKGLKPHELLFLQYYFAKGKPTFLNAPESAHQMFPNKPASYCSMMGNRLRSRLAPHISAWIEEDGLSEARIKEKIFRMLDVKKTIFHKIKGDIKKEDLPEGARLVTTSEIKGKLGLEYENLIAIDVEAPELQMKILEDLIKMKGLNAPEKVEVTGSDEFIQRLTVARQKSMEFRDEPIDVEFTERTETVDDETDLLDFMQ